MKEKEEIVKKWRKKGKEGEDQIEEGTYGYNVRSFWMSGHGR